MNTLGIIGGMSPESTAAYYTQINRLINRQKGGNHSAPILLASVEFQEIVDCQQRGDWHKAGEILAQAARTLEQAGADAVLLATNTMHKVAAPIQAVIGVPFLHILDSVAERIRAQGIRTVGLLGTRFTMQDAFYREGLAARGIQAIVPDECVQAEIHRIIFEELCVGNFTENSRRFYVQAIERLAAQGAQGIILGCTEIGLLVRPEDTAAPLFDTTEIHVQAAAEFILQPAQHRS
ncbi:aspartate/glutamate racemase family protein [Eikenella corrodens]|uniref:Racemase n=2 Tax=Eikenella corrodens TaxID=539 RepID=A0A1A9RM40_EIKCO|nr:aspartate/glutamate racemase family protein [Eikenella corrodens]EEG24888.1 aspartate racemase [Eikenella corrodens ATCC 23834]OAM19884.1 racemase [Eikenella corrodens]OAM29710.1 racemase [Eikenella corrodens]UAK74172.1 aspartate/glutamate racemase family protein [Eikenella corrodens]SNW10552.1 putative racemase [Eikenella corrodens]